MASKLFLSTSPLLPSLSAFPRNNMSFRSIVISCRLQNEPKGLIPPAAVGFHPPVWGDRFAGYVAEPEVLAGEKQDDVCKTKEYIRSELIATTTIPGKGNPSRTMKFIADIQRLGIGYHFEKEIEEALKNIYETYRDDEVNDNPDDLYDVSLRFRLLRQQGFNISCDVFNKFKDENGKLNEGLTEDIRGMLGLYEASHMGKHGEDSLDEALLFTTTHLRDAIEANPGLHANRPLLSQVKKALLHPIRKNIGRLEARYYISVYDQIDSYDKRLLEFAKTDFNMVQSLHKKELSDLTGWWKHLNLAARVPFARNRVVEAYFWMVGVYFEPQYSYGRIILTKLSLMMSYINDAFDSYGTFEQIKIYMDALQRWDINSKDQMPEYLQVIFETTFGIVEEIEEEVVNKQGRPYYHYIRETVINITKSYFDKSRWRYEEYVPTMEEYVSYGIQTSIYPMCVLLASLGVEEVASEETVKWLFEIPRVLRASCIMVRFRNDVVSRKRELEAGGHVATGVECYIKEHGVSEKEAVEWIENLISSEWKHLNGECLELSNHIAPKDLIKIFLGLACIIEVFYSEGDAYTQVCEVMKARIASFFIDPVPI